MCIRDRKYSIKLSPTILINQPAVIDCIDLEIKILVKLVANAGEIMASPPFTM